MAVPASKVIIFYIVFTVLSSILVYGLSVGFGHASVLLPHFSDIGAKPWESTIFTQCFVLKAAFLAFLVQIRFVYVFYHLIKIQASNVLFRTNMAGVFVGYLSAFGLFFLACFQESHTFLFHNLGGVLPFFLGSILYFTIQTAISFKVPPESRQESIVLKTRAVMNAAMFVLFVGYVAAYAVAYSQFKRPWGDRSLWREGDGGWVAHMVSATSQWTLFFLFLLYFLSFYKDFDSVQLTKARIIVVVDEEAGPRTAQT